MMLKVEQQPSWLMNVHVIVVHAIVAHVIVAHVSVNEEWFNNHLIIDDYG